jgi:hypothetical protein
MNIAFIQCFDLNEHGGGAKIIRSLVSKPEYFSGNKIFFFDCKVGKERAFVSSISCYTQIKLPLRPFFYKFEYTRLSSIFYYISILFIPIHTLKLIYYFKKFKIKKVHSLVHGFDFISSFLACKILHIPFSISIHDDLRYLYLKNILISKFSFFCFKYIWKCSNNVFVISNQMGQEYCQLFSRKYFVITDSFSSVLPFKKRNVFSYNIFFGGLPLEIYRNNFFQLVKALEFIKLNFPFSEVSLTIRGGDFFISSSVIPVYVLSACSDEEFFHEVQNYDYLYLPLPFEKKYINLSNFSFSTKFVSYVKSSIPILYHGPETSALNRFIKQNNILAFSFISLNISIFLSPFFEFSENLLSYNDCRTSNINMLFTHHVNTLFWKNFL